MCGVHLARGFSMVGGVHLARCFSMVGRVQVVTMRSVGMVRSFILMARAMMSCGMTMMRGCFFVMIGSKVVVFSKLGFCRHCNSPGGCERSYPPNPYRPCLCLPDELFSAPFSRGH